MKTSVIILARTGSTRFPGKHFAPILNIDKPNPVCALELIHHACTRVMQIDEIVIACPLQDVPVFQEWANAQEEYTGSKYTVFGGDPDNVYARMLAAAIHTGTDVIVDITGDCPLIPVYELQYMVGKFLMALIVKPFEYFSNVFPVRYVPDGWDIQMYTTKAMLKYADQIVWPFHTGVNIPQHSDCILVYNHDPYFKAGADLRITLDTPEDLEVIRKIAPLYMELNCLNTKTKARKFVKHLLQQDPAWWTNREIKPKAVGHE
jgi:spore coat polysaccharide biosynthesis protein SpsF